MSITPERQAEIDAMMEEICGPMPMPKPKAVVVEDKVVRDADVKVSEKDKNYRGSGVVQVRRPEWVTVNMAAYEEQQRWKAEEKRRRKEFDPCRQGLWGPVDYYDDGAA
jgi:hypothetical protein